MSPQTLPITLPWAPLDHPNSVLCTKFGVFLWLLTQGTPDCTLSPMSHAPHLDGLAEATFAQHFSMDEIRWAKDAVWPADRAERF